MKEINCVYKTIESLQKGCFDYNCKNPYSKYSYNSGLVTNNGKPIHGIDIKWLMYEIKQGKLPPLG